LTSLILPFLGNLEGICPLMIIYRVTSGRGWTPQTNEQLSTFIAAKVPIKDPDGQVHGTSSFIAMDTTGPNSQFKTMIGSVERADWSRSSIRSV